MFVFSKHLYCLSILSVLKYGTAIWDPYTTDGQLERVQRKVFVALILRVEYTPQEFAPVLQRLGSSIPCDRRKRDSN